MRLFSIAVITLSLVGLAHAQTTYTATNNAGWNTATTWEPNGIPGAADIAIIPAGKTVTYAGTPSTIGTILISGTFSVSGAGTFGDVWIDNNGTFNPTASGANITFSGNVTNLGNMNITALGSATTYTYSGLDKTLAGNISNVVSTINGTYQNVGTFVTGLKGTQNALKGTGALTNLATLVLANGVNATPTIAVLDCAAAGNLVTWTGANITGTISPKPTAYYDLVIGNTGTAPWVLNGAGLSIAHDLTIVNTGPVASWPADNTIPSTLTYSASSSTASTFPTAFTIQKLNQTAGRLSVPAAGILTVTGTGPGTWTRSGGSFTPNATGTVKFIGGSPEIGGTVVNGFSSLLIESTATNATIGSTLYVTNSLTIAPGALLDVTPVNGGVHAMLGAESFFGSGTLKGAVTTLSGSKVFGGSDGGFGTSHITGDLTMATGSTVNLDVDATAAATHDLLLVDGTLTLNNTVFRLKAPSAGGVIDTANDYTLVTAGNISGTPVLNWVTAPAASTDYSLVTTSTTIKLHYGGAPPRPLLSAVSSGGNLTLSWDTASFPGYTLQGQTNSAGVGGSWADVPGGAVSPFITSIDPANPPVFFRLFKP